MIKVQENGSLTNDYSNFIALSRYARWIESENRRETWGETVSRYVNFMKKSVGDAIDELDTEQIYDYILNLKVMPSMRALMTSGLALERESVAGYNCAYVAVDNLRAFDETVYILMNGTGVGFSVEQKYVDKLPVIAEDFYKTETTIIVDDSKLGWAKAYKELIALLVQGQIPRWDVSKVRPAGARLRTFGGRASGPAPLEGLFKFTIETFKKAAGRRLKPIECHDIMCKIGDIVVVGGVRRSALISLSDLDDYEMATAKSGQWWESNGQRALANNSAVYTEKPPIGLFMQEWQNLYDSKSGERGIINMDSIRKHVESFGRRDPELLAGVNPCGEIILRSNQFCVSPDTPLITKDGIFDIGTLGDKSVEVWNGNRWSKVIVRKTRENSALVRVTFGDGSYLDCTPDHKFSVKNRFQSEWRTVEAQHLMGEKYVLQVQPTTISRSNGIDVDNAYTVGFAVGDGCVYNGKVLIDLYGDKDIGCPVSGYRGARVRKAGYNVDSVRVVSQVDPNLVANLKVGGIRDLHAWSRDSVIDFFSGLADADGSRTGSGGIRIYMSDENRARDAQLVLTGIGIRSSVNLLHRAGARTNLGVRTKDLWYLQITDASALRTHRLDVSNGHAPRFKGKYQTIRSVEPLEYRSDVYCFNEPENHMAVFSNVLTYQCNLTEVVIEPEDTKETLKEKVRIATILGTYQSTLTNFKYLRKSWKKNCEEERLLGVSFTGIFGNKLTNGQTDGLEDLLDELRLYAVEVNAEYAAKLGINPSAAITCVKPSGCRPGTAITITDSGIYTLDELIADHPFDAEWNDVDGLSAHGDRITKTYRNGMAPVAKIKMSYGYELESTPNHKWFVSGYHDGHKAQPFVPAWYRTDELKPGYIIDHGGLYENEVESVLDSDFSRYHNVALRTVPKTMNPDLAWLIGYLWGDGSMSTHKKRLRFTDASLPNLEKAQAILNEQFGYGGNIYKSSGDRKCWSLEVASAEIFDFFVHNGVWKYSNSKLADVPLIVRTASYRSILGFIAGLIDSDGCIHNGNKVTISTSDAAFSKHLQHVALSVGISMGRSHNTKGGSFQQEKSMWLMEINGHSNVERLKILSSMSQKASGLDLSRNAKRVFGKIISVEYSRFVETYDIEVESSHWYYAGGFKSHNTVSQLVGVSSGIHPWYSEYYLRTVRCDNKDPLTRLMIEEGVPSEPDITKPNDITVFYFPMKAPDGAVVTKDLTAIEHLEMWLKYREHWTEHNPSVTINVREHEWLEVGAWVYENFDNIGGVSFLPMSEHSYQQAPYQEINKEAYESWLERMPEKVHWEFLPVYELEDGTKGSQELACTSSTSCEVVDIVAA